VYDRLTFLQLLGNLILLLNNRIGSSFGRVYILRFILGSGGLVFYSTTLQFFFFFTRIELNVTVY